MELSNLQIPNKSHFRVNEVCSITGVKPYVLRFWESEFSQLAPMISSSGQKLYEHKDIENIAKIKSLLFDEKMNVEQAKQKLLATDKNIPAEESNEDVETKGQDSFFSRQKLTDREIQKLVLAKAKLSSMLILTQSIRERKQLH